jgi:hypothetical protein
MDESMASLLGGWREQRSGGHAGVVVAAAASAAAGSSSSSSASVLASLRRVETRLGVIERLITEVGEGRAVT